MPPTTKKPPAPPKMPSTEEAAAVIAKPKDEEEKEGSAVDQIRSDLEDAFQSLTSAWEKLGDLEADQG